MSTEAPGSICRQAVSAVVLLALLLGFVQACGIRKHVMGAKPRTVVAVRPFEVATFGVATGIAIQGMGSMACTGDFRKALLPCLQPSLAAKAWIQPRRCLGQRWLTYASGRWVHPSVACKAMVEQGLSTFLLVSSTRRCIFRLNAASSDRHLPRFGRCQADVFFACCCF